MNNPGVSDEEGLPLKRSASEKPHEEGLPLKRFHGEVNHHRLLLKRTCRNYDGAFYHYLSTHSPQDLSGKLVFSSFLQEVNSDYYGSSCNGLLYFDNLRGRIVVWNPTTGEFKNLPDVVRDTAIGLTTFSGSGFGFDSESGDYKVIRFMTHFYSAGVGFDGYNVIRDCQRQVGLYSLDDDCWTYISDAPSVLVSKTSAYVNGSCYWLAHHPPADFIQYLSSSEADYDTVQSYDFSSGKFSSFLYPPIKRDLGKFVDLVEFDGSVGCTLFWKSGIDRSCFELWVLNLNKNSWTQFFYVVLSGDIERPLRLCTDGSLFFEAKDDQLLVYDRTTQELKKVDDGLGKITQGFPGKKMQIFSYVEDMIRLQKRSNRLLLKYCTFSKGYFIPGFTVLLSRDLYGKRVTPCASFLEKECDIGSSCDGLLYFDDRQGWIVVWNPTTGESKTLPDGERDPAIGWTLFLGSGFGFDSESRDYKVIRFMTHYYYDSVKVDGRDVLRDTQFQVELYSLKDDSWTNILGAPTAAVNNRGSVYVKGSYYWIQLGCPAELQSSGYLSILSYDFSSGKFSHFPYPTHQTDVPKEFYLIEFDGLLGGTAFRKSEMGCCFQLWVLNLDERSWAKKIEFAVGSNVVRELGLRTLLGLCQDGGESIFFEGNNSLLVYNCTTKEWKQVGYSSCCRLEIFSYVVDYKIQLNS